MEGFEGLISAFDMNDDVFKDSVIKIEKDITTIEEKKTELITKVHQPIFQDEEFIQTELRSLIMSARTVMAKVEQDIKIGVDARKIEVYSKLIEAIGKQYSSLIELNKSIFEAKIKTGQVDITNIGNNKISLSSEQLLDMINKASEVSEINKIEADFKIEEE